MSDDLRAEIDTLSIAEGKSAMDSARRAIEAHVFIRRVRNVREEMLRHLDERGIQLTDEDIFKTVS